jgi:hypothetical protein
MPSEVMDQSEAPAFVYKCLEIHSNLTNLFEMTSFLKHRTGICQNFLYDLRNLVGDAGLIPWTEKIFQRTNLKQYI